jgi:hypothetical protein
MTDQTLVTFLLDKSGSMQQGKDDTIGAFNAYLAGLRGQPITFSLLQFDSADVEKTVVNMPIDNVPNLTADAYHPRGGTPLIDAAYETIRGVERALTKRDDTPKIVICIQTDGQENSSTQHTMDELNALIKEKVALGWQFNFMGAGIDAYAQAGRMGIGVAQTVSYDRNSGAAMRSAFSASAAATVRFSSGLESTVAYAGAEKRAAGDAFDPALKHHHAPPVHRSAKTVRSAPAERPVAVDPIDL